MRKMHQVRLAEKRLQQIMRLLDRGAFDGANELLEGAQKDFHAWPNGSGMKYIRARLEEEGVFRGENDVSALDIFSELASGRDEFLSEALIGRGRLLYRIDKEKHLDEVVFLCNEAVKLENNPKAMMILGSIFENDKSNVELAKQWYLRAYRHGSPWGLRAYATLQAKNGELLRPALAHAVTTITAPFMAAWYGLKSRPFK